MKTFLFTLLKIAVVALVLWWLLHHAPVLIMPLVGALGLVVLLAGLGTVFAVLGLGIGVVVVTVLLAAMLAVTAALAPVWLPVLAVVGLVALCRPKRPVERPAAPSAA